MLTPRPHLTPLGTGIVLLFLLLLAGCGDGGPTGPSVGTIQVTTATTGDDLDPDGYSVTLDGGQGEPIGINASVTFSDIAAGSHTVQLSGVPANCSVAGDNPRSVNVTRGATA